LNAKSLASKKAWKQGLGSSSHSPQREHVLAATWRADGRMIYPRNVFEKRFNRQTIIHTHRHLAGLGPVHVSHQTVHDSGCRTYLAASLPFEDEGSRKSVATEAGGQTAEPRESRSVQIRLCSTAIHTIAQAQGRLSWHVGCPTSAVGPAKRLPRVDGRDPCESSCRNL
jgi:hypothetical protein